MNDNQRHSDKYLTFSQRHGYESMPEQMRLEELSDDLRREIWNEARRLLILMRKNTPLGTYYFEDKAVRIIECVIGELKNISEDSVSTDYDDVLQFFKRSILNDPFNKVLDLVELIIRESPKLEIEENRFGTEVRRSFEKYAAAYWLNMLSFPYRFLPCSTKMQGDATRSALATIHDEGMKGAETHLRQAATHINARQFADSIADSIHAVESVARTIDPQAKTLKKALDSLQKHGLLKHPALKEAFSKLYGYTSDEQGIRHALLDKPSPDVDLDEAVFMFGACASFAAYLVNKHRKAAQRQGRNQ